MRPVGYGAMLVECVLGALALTIVCAAASTTGSALGHPVPALLGRCCRLPDEHLRAPRRHLRLRSDDVRLRPRHDHGRRRCPHRPHELPGALRHDRRQGKGPRCEVPQQHLGLHAAHAGRRLVPLPRRLHEHLAALRLRQPAPRRPRPHRARRVPPEHGPQGLDAVGSDDRHVRRHDDGPLSRRSSRSPPPGAQAPSSS